jgi:predicted nucleic acid-binding protein
VRAFADTNIPIYAESDDGERSLRARSILAGAPVISTQVVNEAIAALTRKCGFTRPEANEVATALMDLCEVFPVDEFTVREAMRLSFRYAVSHWDALIVAAALQAGCDVLFSEDLQHEQVFDGRITVLNPFLAPA